MQRKKQFRPRGVRRKKSALKIHWSVGLIFGVALGLFIVMTMVGLLFASRALKPALTELAKVNAKQAMTYALNYGLSDVRLKDLETNSDILKNDTMGPSHTDFFITHKNNQGKFVLVSYDTAKVASFLYDKTERIQEFLRAIDSGKITIDQNSAHLIKINQKPTGQSTVLPLGLLTKTALLGNLGPRIPVRYDFLSDMTTRVRSEVKATGVNNVHLTLLVHVTTNVRLIFPFQTETTTVTKDIPIADITVQGDVPRYYSPASKATKNSKGN